MNNYCIKSTAIVDTNNACFQVYLRSIIILAQPSDVDNRGDI